MNKQLVEQVANDLLKANNTVTTLEIKNELRKQHPNQKWFQSDISDVMDEMNAEGKYSYYDNGTYRVYSRVYNNVVTKPTKKQSKPVNKKPQKVSKTKLLDLIQNSNGKFFGVTFTKKDGTVRKMKCRFENGKAPSALGYLPVVDVREKTVKSLNLQTLSELRINKGVYTV